jgi:hypothetical protein
MPHAQNDPNTLETAWKPRRLAAGRRCHRRWAAKWSELQGNLGFTQCVGCGAKSHGETRGVARLPRRHIRVVLPGMRRARSSGRFGCPAPRSTSSARRAWVRLWSRAGSAARRRMRDAGRSPRLGRPSCRPGTSPLLSEVCGEAAEPVRARAGLSEPATRTSREYQQCAQRHREQPDQPRSFRGGLPPQSWTLLL